MPVLATVRNTGSHFALGVLAPFFTRHNLFEERHTGRPVWFSHTETDKLWKIRERISEDGPLICTLRNPLDVAESWRKRGRPPDNWFCSMWNNLFQLAEDYDAIWLPIDLPNRDDYLARASVELGVPLETDWTPAGVYSDRRPCEGGMTDDQVRHFCRSLPFDYFGYNLDGSDTCRHSQTGVAAPDGSGPRPRA